MPMQVITFRLDGIDDAAYQAHAEQNAPAFAALPGLRAKIWLANRRTNTYGGIYSWDDDAAMTAYQDGPIFAGLRANPPSDRGVRQRFPGAGRGHEGDPGRILTHDRKKAGRLLSGTCARFSAPGRPLSSVGRRERAVLLELVEQDRPLVVAVHGIAGIGKSALLAAFAEDARARGAAVVILDCATIEPTERGSSPRSTARWSSRRPVRLRGLDRWSRPPSPRQPSPRSPSHRSPSPRSARPAAALGSCGGRVVLILDNYEASPVAGRLGAPAPRPRPARQHPAGPGRAGGAGAAWIGRVREPVGHGAAGKPGCR